MDMLNNRGCHNFSLKTFHTDLKVQNTKQEAEIENLGCKMQTIRIGKKWLKSFKYLNRKEGLKNLNLKRKHSKQEKQRKMRNIHDEFV